MVLSFAFSLCQSGMKIKEKRRILVNPLNSSLMTSINKLACFEHQSSFFTFCLLVEGESFSLCILNTASILKSEMTMMMIIVRNSVLLRNYQTFPSLNFRPPSPSFSPLSRFLTLPRKKISLKRPEPSGGGS